LRFNSGSSDYLSQTQGSGNRKTFTVSFWVKKSKTGNIQFLFNANNDSNNNFYIAFWNDDTILIQEEASASGVFNLKTNAVYRDVSAWYHIVVKVDTTQATASDRLKLYINGVQITSFSSSIYPSLNYDTRVNNSLALRIGARGDNNLYLDGYMSEYYFIDGQQLDPTSFGEFDEDSGIWKPIAYTGTYGTNGFYLEFKDSSALGDDTSGNSNDFTVNNLTSIDQTTDTPTNNFKPKNSFCWSMVWCFGNYGGIYW
jgi:hypothetical protein